MRKIISE